jgi:hypothetical protein
MADPTPPISSGTPPKMPRWVKVSGIVLIVLALLIGIMLISGGEHGPGRHIPSGEHSIEHP